MEEFGVNSCVLAVQPLHRSWARIEVHHSRRNLDPLSLHSGWNRSCFRRCISLRESDLKVRELHRSQRIDLIHAHAALPCGHAAVLLSQELKIPCVVTVHGLDAFFDNQVRGFAGQWCRRIAQFVYRSASRVICISDKVAKS